MGARQSKALLLTENQVADIISYYKNHTTTSTIKHFNLTRSIFSSLCKIYDITMHNSSEAETLKHLEQDRYDIFSESQMAEIANYYIDHSMTCTCEHFNVKDYFVRVILEKYNIQLHSTQQEIDLTKHQKYGTAFSKTKEEKEKIELEQYGQLGLSKQEKTAITNKKLYGVENVFANKDIIERLNQTKLARYGDEHFTNREKATETCKERYGALTFLGSSAAREAFTKSAEVRKASFLESFRDGQHELYLQCYDDRELLIKIIQSLPHNTTSQLAEKLNISRNLTYSLIYRLDLFDYIDLDTTSTSYYEEEILDFIGRDICVRTNRQIIAPYEIDIYIPSKKLGIEFNGTYWHSSACNKDKNYHLMKSKLAEEAGIRLIHIYEYEWTDPVQKEKLKLMLNIALGRVEDRIYARQCEVRQISNIEAKKLNERVHLQGHRPAQVTYGLFYNNELVQLMSFSKTKYNRNLATDNSWEIIRGCPGGNNLVVGGVSRLFSHFIKDYQPDYIFSYCDFNKFDGKSYELLGMQFIGYTGPDMKWLLNTGEVVNRRPTKHAELRAKAKAQIFGAGSKKYLWQCVKIKE